MPDHKTVHRHLWVISLALGPDFDTKMAKLVILPDLADISGQGSHPWPLESDGIAEES